MIACVINGVLIAAGSAIGLLFRTRIKEQLCRTLIAGLSVCVAVIGVIYAVKTSNSIIIIVSIVVGTIIGELIDIEKRVDALGERLKAWVVKNREDAHFTKGFVTSTLLFCVGSMAIVGSIEAGINHNYSIIISKSVIDAVISITFAAAMGVGVCFSAFSVVAYQGILTILAIFLGNFLPAPVINEITAVGGVLLICVAINMLNILKDGHIRVANMLPGMLVPVAYIPIASWLSGLF
ncbi:MAG: DUF554 domain-containing protein [Oscillospiraceae bacterium]